MMRTCFLRGPWLTVMGSLSQISQSTDVLGGRGPVSWEVHGWLSLGVCDKSHTHSQLGRWRPVSWDFHGKFVTNFTVNWYFGGMRTCFLRGPWLMLMGSLWQIPQFRISPTAVTGCSKTSERRWTSTYESFYNLNVCVCVVCVCACACVRACMLHRGIKGPNWKHHPPAPNFNLLTMQLFNFVTNYNTVVK